MYFAVATDKAECAFLLLTCMFFYTHSALYMYVVRLSTLFMKLCTTNCICLGVTFLCFVHAMLIIFNDQTEV